MADPKKPIGKSGFIKIAIEDGRPVKSWEQTPYPGVKREQEAYIMNQFVTARSRPERQVTFAQNDENDLDFTVVDGNRLSVMELIEFVRINSDGSPYLSEEEKQRPYEIAQEVMAAIRKKSARYQKGSVPLDLLVYSTHWRFHPGRTTIALCQHYLKTEKTTFERIYFLSSVADTNGHVDVLHPIPVGFDTLGGKTPDDFRVNVEWTLNPAKAELTDTGVKFEIAPDED